MKTPYTFSVVRYIHDVVSGEFVNVGIVVASPEARFIQAKCTHKYERLSHLFNGIDGVHFRFLMSHVETTVASVARQFEHELRFEQSPVTVAQILEAHFATDSSSLQFSSVGGGLTDDPKRTLEQLFERYVEKYNAHRQSRGRNDAAIWDIFKEALKRVGVLSRLKSRTIAAPDFEYHFKHCYVNGAERAMEPVSFDYADPSYIFDKANNWLGRLVILAESNQELCIIFLIGKPQDPNMWEVFEKAKNILDKAPFNHELVTEDERDAFASKVKSQIEEHDQQGNS